MSWTLLMATPKKDIEEKILWYHSHTVTEASTMATLKEEANKWQPESIKNVSDTDSVPVDAEMHTGAGKDKDGVEYAYKYILKSGVKYRIPGTVIGDIKGLLEDMPNLKAVRVKRSGEGKMTRYQVVPLLDAK